VRYNRAVLVIWRLTSPLRYLIHAGGARPRQEVSTRRLIGITSDIDPAENGFEIMRGDADETWFETHNFLGSQHERHERRTWMVVALTAVTMVVEIVAGTWFNSMALLADGWHMATHAGAMGLTALAYRFARRHARNPRFTFGTGKVGDLAAYSSGIILAVAALMIAWESLTRLARPVPIAFDQAILVAALGLAVNIVSAAMLWSRHSHSHARDQAHDHGQGHDHAHHADYNIRAAFLHVVADALTSVLAIIALVAGLWFGAVWLDPLMGLVGAAVILHWSIDLLRSRGAHPPRYRIQGWRPGCRSACVARGAGPFRRHRRDRHAARHRCRRTEDRAEGALPSRAPDGRSAGARP
jgi:cation diffusion facilitator family transporter